MATMKHDKPARKVTYSTAAAALATLVVFGFDTFVLPKPMATGTATTVMTAVTTLTVFLAGYFVPPHPDDTINSDSVAATGTGSVTPKEARA